ncbi:dihydroorotate dehydrogenase-like protein [Prolixibacter sp. SD074]|jgi:dihydroorotate dehydrogenase (fumarate)|uniref:dihydroorotate dehydrogenase-like protein n=1 Tax=Prolixibacter sp. SD074 TaxID=2652391 RepID=UPI00128A417C|nr:dihydroorotate dehydrogenase-like protein [Prolixibacter sp. SD074]GET27831.1 dihydroorotate dehydrogenase [Prolixibacter sp. SD074]GET31117.1 dihydroorotate dehydrogenase [Prolixibacter sp. SD074]
MADLKTTYMGVQLKNPIILGASSIVDKLETVKKIERAGVGAIVYRSLFEEQIHLEEAQLDDMLGEYDERNAEMVDIFPNIKHAGAKEHLYQLKKTVDAIDVPVFASLNAIYDSTWIEYAKQLEETGVAGVELNFYSVPVELEKTGASIEEHQLSILRKVKKAVKIPVSVKISSFYSNPLNFVQQLDKAKTDAVVLFNRFFQPEINIETEEFYYPFDLTHEKDYQVTLRFAGLLYGQIKGDICASRGISDGKDLIKMLLAGATTVQVVSTIFRNKAGYVTKMLDTLEQWMDEKGYKTVDEFRGKLAMKNLKEPYAYKRAQYVDILMNSTEIIKKYPMI